MVGGLSEGAHHIRNDAVAVPKTHIGSRTGLAWMSDANMAVAAEAKRERQGAACRAYCAREM